MLKFVTFLIAATSVTHGKIFTPEEAFDILVNEINCNSNNSPIIASDEVLTAYRTCNRNVEMMDGTCMFPCIANEMGLIVRNKLNDSAVSRYVSKQFKTLNPEKQANWTKSITECFHQYELSGEMFPTDYQDCYQQTEGFLQLSTCILRGRGCPDNLGNVDTQRNELGVKQRAKRALSNFGRIFYTAANFLITFPATYMGLTSAINSFQCSPRGSFGCYKGYCFSYCGVTNRNGEWCYTTKSYSQSYEYVKCNSTSQCDGCWNCAGSCTIFTT